MSHEKLGYCFRIVRLLWRKGGREEKEGGKGGRKKEGKEKERGKEGEEHFVMFTTAVPYEKMFRFRNFLL